MSGRVIRNVFIVIFVVALVVLFSSGTFNQLTGHVIGEGDLEKDYFESFEGDVTDPLVFDLGKVVTVDLINVVWTDDRNTCWGRISVSENGEDWFVKRDWKDIASPEELSLERIGDVQYLKFEKSGCRQYSVSKVIVEGTYIK